MNNFLKIFFTIWVLLLPILLKAQVDVDTVSEKIKLWRIESPENLGDTVWLALMQKTDKLFLSLIPTVEALKETFDSLEIKNNPQVIKIKHNYISYRLQKQFKALKHHAKINEIKFKHCKLNEIKVREGKNDKGVSFAYITLYCSKSKKEFTIKLVALKLYNYWYISDELKMEMKEDNPYYQVPVKKR